MTTVSIGARAEEAAAVYVCQRGYRIIERNYRRRHCEIDIVAARNGVAYFIEVKYRRDDHFGDGLAYIAHDKLRRMIRASETWVRENQWYGEYALAAIEVGGPKFVVLTFIEELLN